MKILQVVHGYPPELIGGTERYAEALCATLKGRGHELRVISGSVQFTGAIEFRDDEVDGIPVTRVQRGDLYFDSWDKTYNPHLSTWFRGRLREQRPDLLHIHHWVRLTSDIARLAHGAGIPVVATLHDFYATCPRTFRLRDETIPCDRSVSPSNCSACVPRWDFQKDEEIAASIDAYAAEVAGETRALARAIAPSRSHAELSARFQPELEGKIDVLGHPCLTRIDPVPRSEPKGKLRIGCWSHLHPLKGQDVLLQAIRKLRDPSAVAVDLWGESFLPDFRKTLDALAEGLEVTFRGGYSPPDLSLEPMDIAVLPTIARESYSFILDEASMLGVPILASRTGALIERATDRVRLFEPGDVEALSANLQALVDSPEARAAMEQAPGPEVVDIETHTDRVEAIYREAISQGRETQGSCTDDPVTVSRLCREWDRREAAFQELLRSQGWESVIAEKNAEIERLQREVDERDR